ncbi:MAG: exonuclease domain-containing protein [Flavobacteriales bacterium]|jgi:DNA polymerase-3 subunit epsilon
MKLHLERPLAIFDLETTGTDVGRDRIVEIALVKVMPDGQVNTWPAHRGPEHRFLINPMIPIAPEATMVHGISNEMVQSAPTFAEVAPRLFAFLLDCDLGGFNSNRFDIPLLAEEFLRADIDFSLEGRNLIDVQVIFHLMEPRTLRAAYKFYCNKTLDDAHEALPDALATFEVFEAMMDRYEGVEMDDGKGNLIIPVRNDMKHIHALGERRKKADLAGHLVYNDRGEVVFSFGKYKGQPVAEVLQKDPGYFSWVQNAEFPLYTKKVLADLRQSMKSS